MACTTILVGKKASYDGSTLVARNEDSCSGQYNAKKLVAVASEGHPEVYHSVLAHLDIDLPKNPMSYTLTPDAVNSKGVWGACGVNSANVAMTATETITSNARVLAADPLVIYQESKGEKGSKDYQEEMLGGISEEDMVSLVLPYIHSAREGVQRLASLLETYGTSEMNGIAFQDVNEIWWLETIGGHHWIAKRVPDDSYVVMPNQFGIDTFDLEDAFGPQKDHMCSSDLRVFIEENHLDLSIEQSFQPRLAFGSRTEADKVYNTPRAWVMGRFFNPNTYKWEGPEADYTPESFDIPWSFVPEHKITVHEIKEILSNHYQGTPYDPYALKGESKMRGAYRTIGINRNNFLGLTQIRPYIAEKNRSLQWMAFGSNVFNAMLPLYTQVSQFPSYLSQTNDQPTTDSLYWSSRMIAALADAHYPQTQADVESYQAKVDHQALAIIKEFDEKLSLADESQKNSLCEEANQQIVNIIQKETQDMLKKVLYTASNGMKNAYARSDN
ncbi:C69 family dipeptidase [Facklamia miroungae]|uniref:Dipeptidase n=1 Tax=Facklamia miroungae TaxID=120956 RepID=A0A1G7TYW0_9LACT|nr:C69 family dipeptidase [Facklamia miroungae]NKZ30012.1 C69 family dipeptidase [Facklamia miroungae]SDG39949.1 dipeptidase [Facklamia miroungae]